MKILSQFKEFAVKGNVVDMAVGIIIGAAFTTVVKTLVEQVVMPPLGVLTGRLDFADRYLLLREGAPPSPYATLEQAKSAGAVVVGYGLLVNAVVSFVLVAIVLFFIVRWVNELRRPDAPAPPSMKDCRFCKSKIHLEATRCPECTSHLDEVAAG